MKYQQEEILEVLKNNSKPLTCQEICYAMLQKENNLVADKVTNRLSAAVSSSLKKMIDKKLIKYALETGPRGGYRYELNS